MALSSDHGLMAAHMDRGVISADGSKKARIERAALTLFAQNGIDHVTTKAIARAAEVSEGLIYRHFNNKEDLARALMRAAHDRLTSIIKDSADLPDIGAQIRQITSHYCEIYIHRFPNISDDPTDNPLSAAKALIEAAMMRGDIPTENAHILAPMALGIVLQTAQAKVLGFVTGPLGDHLDLFVRRIEAVLDI